MYLHIPHHLWQRMHYYARASLPNEVTGIGLIEILPDQRGFLVTEIFLPQQHTSLDYCETDDYALNGIISDLLERDPALVEQLCFRWHSHGTGKVFFSSVDIKDINAWEGDWVINLVINALGERVARADAFQPIRIGQGLEVVIDYPEDPDLWQECCREVSERVQVLDRREHHELFQPGEKV